MARLHISSDDEDDLPDLEDLLRRPAQGSGEQSKEQPRLGAARIGKDSQTLSMSLRTLNIVDSDGGESLKPKQKREERGGAVKKQRALRKIGNNSVLLKPLGNPCLGLKKDHGNRSPAKRETTRKESIPVLERKGNNEEASEYEAPALESDDWSEDDLPVKPRRRKPVETSKQERRPKIRPDSQSLSESILNGGSQAQPELCRAQTTPIAKRGMHKGFRIPRNTTPFSLSRPSSSSDHDRAALLVYTPIRTVSPRKIPPISRPSTPPPRTGLQSRPNSPSKTKIPPTPHGPSLDEFWSQELVNEWNEQYSPRKTLTSPRKKRHNEAPSDAESDFVCPSPILSPRKSPTKKTAKEREAKKSFEAQKQELAESFLKELDNKITNGEIAQLTCITGGVAIIWSKKLNSTAGRANWRRESTTKKYADGRIDQTYKHHANIELAEKVIDDEDRLLNVLAHEFCHLANFMVSGVKDNPHGREFKEWAKKCSAAFGDRGVVVTTKHSYAIDYKYVWECVSCQQEFKRHSKSIDPAKHTCGVCKSKLVQTKPTARNVKVSEYQLFVKEHFQRVKKESGANSSHGTVMETLGRLYREQKATKSTQSQSTDVDDIVQCLDVVSLVG